MMKYITLCLAVSSTVLLPAPARAADIIDTAPIKRHVINHCKKRPSPQLITACLVDGGELFMLAKNALYQKGGKDTWRNCAGAVNLNDNTAWFHLLTCITKQHELKKTHPMPEYADTLFLRTEMRANWASQCRQLVGNKISTCMKDKHRAFERFWQYYLSYQGEQVSSKLSRRFSQCLPSEIPSANFDHINICLGVK
jgi:hypothetical protein